MKHSKKFYLILIALVIVINFLLPRFMPGSPVADIAGESVGELSGEQKEALLDSYGLNDPLHEQFFNYVVDFFTLDWGTSYTKNEKITTLILQALPWTLLLSLTNLIISTIIGCYLGYRSSLKRKEKKDIKYMGLMSMLTSLPLFWVGMAFIAIFSVELGWFPLGNAYSLWEGYTGFALVLDVIWHMVLPVTTLVTATVLTFFTSMRFGVLGVISKDYIMMARLRGLSEKRINFVYILRNSIIPVFTVFMTEIGFILSGSVVIESIFSYPGIGKLMYDAVLARDYPLVQYSFIIVALMVILANFIADILYSKLDVRLKS